MSLYDALAGLPVAVDGVSTSPLDADVSSGDERLTTVVHLTGDGREGVGEDVVYSDRDQRALRAAGAAGRLDDLAGRWTLGDFCAAVDARDLFFGAVPEYGDVSRLYRRWTLHSAALDLALRQAGLSLHEALARPVAPLRFVVSLSLGDPAIAAPVVARLVDHPGLHFKLDVTASWDDALVAELAATGAVVALDFKAHYEHPADDRPIDPALYRRVAAAFPEAWLEDPALGDPAVAAALAGADDRITWDAPIHSVADLEALPSAPRMVNVKASRLGGLRPLCEMYDFCAAHGIGTYGGGQFELGPGRGQAQYLAAIFHPEAPNDLSPVGYHAAAPAPDLPGSPLPPAPPRSGFRWDAD